MAALDRLHELLPVKPRIITPRLKTGYRRKVEWRARIASGRMRLGYFRTGSREFMAASECPVLHPLLSQVLEYLSRAPFPRLEISLRIVAQLYDHNRRVALVLISESNLSQCLEVFLAAPAVGYCKPRAEVGRELLPVDGRVWVRPGGFYQAHVEADTWLREFVRQEFREAQSLVELFCGNAHLSFDLPAVVTGYDIDCLAAQALCSSEHRYQECDLYGAKPPELSGFSSILADPGRPGLRGLAQVINACTKLRHFVYISCSPASLAVDLGHLLAGGWQAERWLAMDFFPWTKHWEQVVVLRRP